MLNELLTETVPARTTASAVEDILNTAFWIRAFESTLLDLFKQGLLAGTVHTCIGQELCAAALHPHLVPGVDAFFASHRGHGHYLAYGGPAGALLAELAGREGALCLGRGGTQNLLHQRFFSAGIQGGSAPIAVGFAWAARRRGEHAIAVAQLGDGTLGEGTVYEAFTFAAWLGAPVLFLLEHNGWAQSTDVTTTTPGDILQRAAGFGLEADWCDDRDPAVLHERLGRAVAAVRRGQPFLQVVQTRRLMAHSKGDDNRPKEYIASLWRADPLSRLAERDETWRQRQTQSDARARRLAREVADRPLLDDADAGALPAATGTRTDVELRSDGPNDGKWERVADELNAALHNILAENPEVVLVGEDLLDPYGGAFKVARGLSSRYPEQVLSTPIAEAGLMGLSNGMALAGMRPIAEIMFADFATLAADQLINFAAKYYFMYGGRVTCPVTVRLVSGGGRGYGPTHSQSLERLFCGVPGLRVVALSQRHHPGRLLRQVVLSDHSPTVFVENKLLYALRPCDRPPTDLRPVSAVRHDGGYPPLCYRPRGEQKADCTIVAYGGMTGPAEAAMQQMLVERELSFDYVILTQLWPLDVSEVVASVRQTRRLVVVEENVPDFSVGSAVLAAVAQQVPEGFACRAVGARPVPLPCVRRLEEKVLPSAAVVVQAIGEVV
ncbi:MAG TPA: thiamine pyrophosphate-dependent enzyme [Gemmataceae bacterium]